MAGEPSMEARGQLAAMLRRRLRLLIAFVVLGIALGAGAAFMVPAQYSATASVLVSPLEGNPYSPEGRGDDLINLETEAQLVQTDTVAKLAQAKLRGGNIAALRLNVSVTVPPNTQVLNITYTAASVSAAEAGTRAFAESYLQYRQQRAQAVLDGKLKKLAEQSKRVEANLRTATQRLAASSGTQRAFLTQRITAYTNQLGVIDEQSNDISSTPVSPGQVINPASAPAGASLRRFAEFGAAGLAVGLVLGLALALLRERLDQRLRTPEQVEALGLRVLTAIPPDPRRGGELVLVSAPRSPAGESYRRLRSGIVAHIPSTPIALLVTSATPGTTAASIGPNLAVALAYAGSDTILVDATADDPDPAAWFGLPPAKGLSDVLLAGSDPAALLIHADSQLRLLPRGPSPSAATHRFSGPRMRSTVETLRDRADFLLVSAPNVHDADAQALCTLVDMVVLVAHGGVTTREQVMQAHAEVVHAGARVLGVVLESGGRSSGGGRAQRPARAHASGHPPVPRAAAPQRPPVVEQATQPPARSARPGRAGKPAQPGQRSRDPKRGQGTSPADRTVDLEAELADDSDSVLPTAGLPIVRPAYPEATQPPVLRDKPAAPPRDKPAAALPDKRAAGPLDKPAATPPETPAPASGHEPPPRRFGGDRIRERKAAEPQERPVIGRNGRAPADQTLDDII